jgi:hypothetical protein
MDMFNKLFFNRLRVFSLIVLTTILTTCKPERANPWDMLADISPNEWAPNNLSIEDVNILEKRISWNYAGDNRIEGFKLDRKVGNDNWEVAHQAFDKSTKSWNDTDITPDTTITYSYRLYSFAGENKSAEATITSKPVFLAPTNLHIEKVNDIKYKLTWNDNSVGEQGFKIDRRTDNGEWIIAHGIIDANQTNYIDTNVFVAKSSINVEYRIYAYYQSYETTKTLANTNAALTPPTNLQITQNSITSVTLNWEDNSTGEEGFKIERKFGENSWVLLTTTKNTTIEDSTFELNTQVYYRISAYIGGYNSSYVENSFNSTIPSPTNLSVSVNSATSVTLNWNYENNGHDGFIIDRKPIDGSWQNEFAQVGPTQFAYTDNSVNLESNGYSFRIYAFVGSYNSEKTEISISKPTITTANITDITGTTAAGGGSVTSDGGLDITSRGVSWSTSENPTISDSHTTDGAGTGSFTSSITGLQPGTTYYVRAYATNTLGISYGESLEFTASIILPTVTTSAITNITGNSATSGGNVTYNGGGVITQRGVVWSIAQTPTLDNNNGYSTDGSGLGAFTSNIAPLLETTQYYVRAYATNETGTSYGIQLSFITLSPWTQMATLGGVKRSNAVGFTITDKGYIGTGVNSTGDRLSDFWEYNQSTNTWTQKANFSGAAREGAAGFAVKGYGYIGVGWSTGTQADFFKYNPVSNSWVSITDRSAFRNSASFNIGDFGYFGTGNNDYYFSGFTLLTGFHKYNPETNSWSSVSNFGGAAREFAVGFSIGEKGYVATGRTNATSFRNDFWEYDPVSNGWTQKADFGGTPRYGAVGFSMNGKGYIGLGQDSQGFKNDFWEYDPATNSWTQKSNFGGTARINAVGFTIGNKGYIGTGNNGDEYFNDFWEYNPELD